VRRMAARVCIPVIADGDTGYGDLHNVSAPSRPSRWRGRAGFYWRTK
jgi:2-methylisocitrate lyase-like PEP mutase family enzyme